MVPNLRRRFRRLAPIIEVFIKLFPQYRMKTKGEEIEMSLLNSEERL
jgi:hypothetical protein